jgi:hypothetical protein
VSAIAYGWVYATNLRSWRSTPDPAQYRRRPRKPRKQVATGPMESAREPLFHAAAAQVSPRCSCACHPL